MTEDEECFWRYKRSTDGVLTADIRKLLILLERETGIEPATFSLGS